MGKKDVLLIIAPLWVVLISIIYIISSDEIAPLGCIAIDGGPPPLTVFQSIYCWGLPIVIGMGFLSILVGLINLIRVVIEYVFKKLRGTE